jgi:V/A-type H+/Na+-transporting ATPase subunit I
MGLRPVAARWFEALAARDDLSRLAEALAQSGVVQIEAAEDLEALDTSAELAAELEEFDRLARRYQSHWPPGAAGARGTPQALIRDALARLRAWRSDADPVIERIERIQDETSDLELVLELLLESGDDFPELGRLRRAGPTLAAQLFILPRERAVGVELPAAHLARRVETAERVFLLLVGSATLRERVRHELAARKARVIELPEWLDGTPAQARRALQERIAALGEAHQLAQRELEKLHLVHGIATALGDVVRLRWFVSSVPKLPETRHFAVVTGWTSDRTGATLRTALAESGVHALLHFPPAPEHREAPVVLENPKWVRPFETFAGLLGTPGRHESDPSALLAVIAPVLFGFMFADVGQGLVLVAVGLLAKKRVPLLRLLIPGGAAAAVFGLLFGSVFAREDLIPALIGHPLALPLEVLVASLAIGAVTLLAGLALSGVQAAWSGALGRWLSSEGPLVLIYLGLLGMVLDSASGVAVATGVVWLVLAAASGARRRRATAVASALGHLVERTLQLLVNTVSFARVGAFALAHAGLCTAIASLALAARGPIASLAVLVLGNAFTILLEGLVVSIQTTRLVLFEFFVRFLRGEGRAFRPLSPPLALGPPTMSQGVRVP